LKEQLGGGWNMVCCSQG